LVFDLTGVVGVFITSSVVTLLAALVALLAFRKAPLQAPQPAERELVVRHG
jgi:hypothetical protein